LSELTRKSHTVVLFGAGASYACTNVLPRPPLGKELFDRLANSGAMSAIPDEVKEVFRGRGFEAGMAALFDAGSHRLVHVQKQVAEYLLTMESEGSTLYDSILTALAHKKVLWSCLNYDCLIESAAQRVYGSINYNVVGAKRTPNILKVHGSASFGGPPNFSMRGIDLGFPRGTRAIDGPLSFLTRAEALRRWRDPLESIGPAMSLFIEGKDEMVSHKNLEAIREKWAEQVRLARRVVCIGVHIHAPDKHIWDVIAATEGKVAFVGPERDLTKVWAESVGHRRVSHLADAFSDVAIGKIRRFVCAD